MSIDRCRVPDDVQVGLSDLCREQDFWKRAYVSLWCFQCSIHFFGKRLDIADRNQAMLGQELAWA